MSQEYVSLVLATESPFCKILIQFPYRHIDDVHWSKSNAGQAVFTTLAGGIYNPGTGKEGLLAEMSNN